MRISDWSSDVCSSDLTVPIAQDAGVALLHHFLHVGLARHPAPQVRRQRPAVFGEERLEGLRFARDLVGGVGSAGKVYDVPHERNRRSEERRVGQECVSTGRSRWSPDNENKNKKQTLIDQYN